MTADAHSGRGRPGPTFSELFTPKLVTVLREGYGLQQFRADAIAGLTVAVVALPLSMAIAIASGVSPDRGLYTAIIGGFIVSLLGGSRFQIGGPAGAFIVLVAATVAQHGIDGLILATMMSGVFLLAVGYLRLGTYIKFIPYPVTVGFTAGIAVIIFASQLSELFGLSLAGGEPGDLIGKLMALGAAAGTVNPAAVGIAALTIGTIVGLKRLKPSWPGMLIAVAAASVAAAAFSLPVETIGTRFGGIPQVASIAFIAGFRPRKNAGGAARRDLLHAARRDRIAAVGGGRRWHDRAAPPLQLRAGGAGFRQYRLGAVRRHSA